MAPRTEGTVFELRCQCGYVSVPGNFVQEGSNFKCPICDKVVTLLQDIIQEALRIDTKKFGGDSDVISH